MNDAVYRTEIKMAKIVLFLVLVLVVGCGGPSFTVSLDTPDGGHAADALAAAGGAPVVGFGGAASGGAPSSGGASAGGSSGSPDEADAGGHGSGSGGATVENDAGSGVPLCGTLPVVTHDNGNQQTWQDCVPLGTYNEAQAMKACKASGAVMCILNKRCGVGAVQGWNADVSHLIGEWGYEDFATGYVSLDFNLCGGASDPGRRQWR